MSNMREAYGKWKKSLTHLEEYSEIQIWQAACKWQIEQDAKICDELQKEVIEKGLPKDIYTAVTCAAAIRNQEKSND